MALDLAALASQVGRMWAMFAGNPVLPSDATKFLNGVGGYTVPPGTGPSYATTTWVPADASGAALSLTITDATYTKIGRLVFVTAQIIYPVTADGSNAVLSGLPLTPSFVSNCAVSSSAVTSQGNGHFNPDGKMYFFGLNSFTQTTNVQLSGSTVNLSGCYESAS